jgi:hypothetical protein
VNKAAIDDAAADAFFTDSGDAARALPPVAIVIAAFNDLRAQDGGCRGVRRIEGQDGGGGQD